MWKPVCNKVLFCTFIILKRVARSLPEDGVCALNAFRLLPLLLIGSSSGSLACSVSDSCGLQNPDLPVAGEEGEWKGGKWSYQESECHECVYKNITKAM